MKIKWRSHSQECGIPHSRGKWYHWISIKGSDLNLYMFELKWKDKEYLNCIIKGRFGFQVYYASRFFRFLLICHLWPLEGMACFHHWWNQDCVQAQKRQVNKFQPSFYYQIVFWAIDSNNKGVWWETWGFGFEFILHPCKTRILQSIILGY